VVSVCLAVLCQLSEGNYWREVNSGQVTGVIERSSTVAASETAQNVGAAELKTTEQYA